MHVKLPMCFTWHFKGPILANPLTLYVPHAADSCLEDEETTQGEHSVVLWNSHGLMATASTRPASKAASGNGLCIGMSWIAVFNSSKIFKDSTFALICYHHNGHNHQLSSTIINSAIQLFHFRNFKARCLPWFRLVIRWLQSWRPQSMTVGPFDRWPMLSMLSPRRFLVWGSLGIAGASHLGWNSSQVDCWLSWPWKNGNHMFPSERFSPHVCWSCWVTSGTSNENCRILSR